MSLEVHSKNIHHNRPYLRYQPFFKMPWCFRENINHVVTQGANSWIRGKFDFSFNVKKVSLNVVFANFQRFLQANFHFTISCIYHYLSNLFIKTWNESGCEPLNLENKLWKSVMRYCSYIHYIHTLRYLPWDFIIAYAANISEHSTIRWEMDHHTGNYVNSCSRTLRNYLWCEGSLAFEKAHKAFFHSGVYVLWYLQNEIAQPLRNWYSGLPTRFTLHVSICTYLPCAVVKNSKIILFGQEWCVRLNETHVYD